MTDPDYKRWLDDVDDIVLEMAGVSRNDLADYGYADAYLAGVTAREAAHDLLSVEGFPFEDIDVEIDWTGEALNIYPGDVAARDSF